MHTSPSPKVAQPGCAGARTRSFAVRRSRTVYYRSAGGHLEQRTFDAQYVQQLTEGDPSVVNHFTSYFTEIMRLTLRRRGWSFHDVEDISQETFARVLQTLRGKGLQHPERLGAFVHSVCKNTVLEFCRSHRRSPTADEEAPEPVDGALGMEGVMVSRELKGVVHSVLQQLPEADRRVLRMVFFEEADRDEVCATMNVTRDYLRVLLHRALRRFKDLGDASGAFAKL